MKKRNDVIRIKNSEAEFADLRIHSTVVAGKLWNAVENDVWDRV